MNIRMNDEDITSVAQLEELVKLGKCADITRLNSKKERYEWIERILTKTRYLLESKKNRGIIRKYLILYGGWRAAQVDRLIAKKDAAGKVELAERTQPEFSVKYTGEDIELLAEVSESYRHQNGKALKEVFREMYDVYKDERFERLRGISVSHIYNLRKSSKFKDNTTIFTKTRPVSVPIGIRKKPIL